MVAQLKHVRIILSQNGDSVTLLSDHQPRLLLVGVAQVDSVKLKTAVANQKQVIKHRGPLRSGATVPRVVGLHILNEPFVQCCLPSLWTQTPRHSLRSQWRSPVVPLLSAPSRCAAPPNTAFRAKEIHFVLPSRPD